MAGDNRIALSGRDINNYLKRIRDLRTPPELRVQRRELSKPTDSVTISKADIKVKELKLHPETPSADLYLPPIEQRGGTLATLLVLFPQGEELIRAANQEQKLLGVTAHA